MLQLVGNEVKGYFAMLLIPVCEKRQVTQRRNRLGVPVPDGGEPGNGKKVVSKLITTRTVIWRKCLVWVIGRLS